MSKSTELFWIACNRNIELEIRYAAARQIQSMRIARRKDPRVGVPQEPYSDYERKRIPILQAKGIGQKKIGELFGRSRAAIKSMRYRIRKAR